MFEALRRLNEEVVDLPLGPNGRSIRGFRSVRYKGIFGLFLDFSRSKAALSEVERRPRERNRQNNRRLRFPSHLRDICGEIPSQNQIRRCRGRMKNHFVSFPNRKPTK